MDQQQREQRALTAAGHRERRGSVHELERTEDPVFHVQASERRYQRRLVTASGTAVTVP
jgi:Ser/Thr protein kinase RdoA (MazF antagonist)